MKMNRAELRKPKRSEGLLGSLANNRVASLDEDMKPTYLFGCLAEYLGTCLDKICLALVRKPLWLSWMGKLLVALARR
jgi:hypothetical protein